LIWNVNYTALNASNQSGSGTQTRTLSGVDGMRGASLVWNVTSPTNRAEYAGQKTVTGVIVEKQIKAREVTSHCLVDLFCKATPQT